MAGYLPPGWTEEMYEKPMEHEAAYDALTDEVRSADIVHQSSPLTKFCSNSSAFKCGA